MIHTLSYMRIKKMCNFIFSFPDHITNPPYWSTFKIFCMLDLLYLNWLSLWVGMPTMQKYSHAKHFLIKTLKNFSDGNLSKQGPNRLTVVKDAPTLWCEPCHCIFLIVFLPPLWLATVLNVMCSPPSSSSCLSSRSDPAGNHSEK